MRLPMEWLQEQFDAPADTLGPDCIAKCLMNAGFELEGVEYGRPGLETVVTGKVLTAEPHPNADRLRICQTDIGKDQPLQIITAAPNVQAGDTIPVALVGSNLPSGKEIGHAKMRGIDSFGMFCSAVELGLDAASPADRNRLRDLVRQSKGDLPADALEKAVDLCFEFVMVLPEGTGLGLPIANVLKLGDSVLAIAITANRGDALSLRGLAREMAALGFPDLARRDAIEPGGGRSGSPEVTVRLEDPDLCPRYAGQVVRGIKVGPSPAWLAKRLELSGIRPINNIVDVTNYVLLEFGQPLHAFDLAKLSGAISARRARAGETIVTLDDAPRQLEEGILVIADDRAPVAVAGVMGGKDSAVSEGTVDILLEAAYFNPSSVRRTAKKLGLSSESSYRFERGVDPENTARALERAAQLVAEIAGGTVSGPPADVRHEGFPQDLVVSLRPARTDKILGLELPEAEQISYLTRLGFAEVPGYAALPAIAFRVPGWRRHDVTREVDLIEEVARLAGYDKVPSTLPPIESLPPVKRLVHEALRPVMRGAGFSEIVTPPLCSPAMQSRVLGNAANAVSLTDPLGEMSILRLSLLPSLLEVARLNLNHGADRVAVFEAGKVYRREWGSNTETLQVAALAVGDVAEGMWKRAPEALQADFWWAKGLAEAALASLGLAGLEALADSEQPGFHPGRAARFESEGRTLAIFGEIHPHVAEAFDLPAAVRTAAIVLMPDAIEAALAHRGRKLYEPISRFPGIVRDLAIVVDDSIAAGKIVSLARTAGQPLLEDARIFDRYQGPQVPAGKVSLALSLRYRSADRTLTDTEVEAVHQSVVERLKDQFGAALR